MLKPINAMDIACIRQRNDFEPELRCLEELLVLREAVIALTNPAIINNEQREIAYRLVIQGIEVHPGYQRGSHHGWPRMTEDEGKGGESRPGDEPLGCE